MDKPKMGIIYKHADGKRISLDVSIEVKSLLEQTDRQIRSQGRQDRRYLDFVGSVNDLDNLITQPQEDTESLVIKMDSYNRLYTAIDKLPEMQRRRLLLHYFHNLTYQQIADMESVNQSAVGQSIKRAIAKLSKHLTN
jgi:RNA polymerase sigma factor (sigma-70 family)